MIRGVNLGGWLVLERWITPSLFSGLEARDEYTFCKELGNEAADILKMHQDNFIREADFAWLAQHGVNAVRLPLGYWIFGDEKPYVGAIEYVDKAMTWAETHSLGVVLDLHGAPGSQNGRDHSGRVGDIYWNNPENISKSLKLVEKLAERYKGSKSLMGIELLNEPSWRVGHRTLRRYYERGYEAVRKHCGNNVSVIVSDAYRPKRWKRLMRGARYQNVVLDVHLYQSFSRRDKKLDITGHLRKTTKNWQSLLRTVGQHSSVMVGEWSLGLAGRSLRGLSDAERDLALRAYASAQLLTFENAQSWFFWTYRTENMHGWSYRTAVEKGWLPSKYVD